MRWLWIDHFVEFKSRESARAVKNLSWAEDHFQDHFPGWPVMPATLILEGLAQTGGILAGEAHDFREKVVLAKINKARFHREARAGEQLVYDVELIDLRPEGASIRGIVKSADQLVAEAELMFAHLDQSRSGVAVDVKNFVFSGELKKLLGLNKLIKEEATSP